MQSEINKINGNFQFHLGMIFCYYVMTNDYKSVN